MGAAIQHHVGEEFGLVHLTGLGAGDSDPYGDFILHQIGQVVIGAIPRGCFDGQISTGIGPFHTIVNKKEIHLMPFGMGDLAQLKTPGSLFNLVFAQDK
jgi:hypothetical protein